ncbi:E3 ubiquitin/ISG15 ligase TRIM25-like [Dendropsophus ebraccatus]|uniref:E3 ubiquitin/ISG15 ligase TRIM25-like n=1 Tax=Dendropsophus ebraccatus TaxID=150705 RepID=UPI00383225CA
MATADLREELSCSICLNVYTDPVTLRCGHNFCRDCIDRFLGAQEGVGAYSCPECKEEFRERPTLQRNITLHNIIARCLTSQPEETAEGVFCTYCVHPPVAAVRSCLHCEVSLCEDHLRVHSKSPEHVLSEPSASLHRRKCSVHKKILEYYCTQDASCICVTCCLAGEHAGHKVEQLTEASNKKKEMLKTILTELLVKRAEAEEKGQSLQERRRAEQERATRLTETVTTLFIDIRRQVDDLEKKVLGEISQQEEQATNSISELIQQLEIMKAELSVKMSAIERLCNMRDPLMVLKEEKSGREDFCDTEKTDAEARQAYDAKVQSIGGPDERAVLVTLQTGLADIVSSVKVGVEQKVSDIVFDLHTVQDQLNMSDRIITWNNGYNYNRPATPERFQTYPQVLSTKTFASGSHYWEWEVSYGQSWSVGMCYPRMERMGERSCLGFNNKSWCLWIYGSKSSVIHDSSRVYLPHVPVASRYRMCLDYEAGRLSFYELCDPIKHLHTFTTTFTGPLHVACYLWGNNCTTGFTKSHTPLSECDRRLNLRLAYQIYTCFQQELPIITLKTMSSETGGCRVSQIICTHREDSHVIDRLIEPWTLSSLCEDHLRVHSKSPEHVLSEPSASLHRRKCSVHKKILEYYCTQDASCICVTCCLAGEHAGHKVEQLTEASNKKKEMLKTILTELLVKRAEAEEKGQSLQERRRAEQERATRLTETVTTLFIDIRRQVDELEGRVLGEISRQEEKVTNPISDLIQQLEVKKLELSVKMSAIEILCNMSDPLMVLKEQKSRREDFCDTEKTDGEERQAYDAKVQSISGLDERAVLVTLQTGLADIVSGLKVDVEEEKVSDIVLDRYTNFDPLIVSDRSITWNDGKCNSRPATPEKFQTYPQVLSTKTFSSGSHYWEWEINVVIKLLQSYNSQHSQSAQGDDSLIHDEGFWRYGGNQRWNRDGKVAYVQLTTGNPAGKGSSNGADSSRTVVGVQGFPAGRPAQPISGCGGAAH